MASLAVPFTSDAAAPAVPPASPKLRLVEVPDRQAPAGANGYAAGGRNWTAMAAIAAGHAGLIALLLTTGVVRLPAAAPAPVAVAFVEEIAEPPLEQPAVEAALEPVATDIFVPEVVVETPAPPPPVVTVTEVPLPPQAVVAPPAAARGGGDAAVTPPDFSADQLNNPGPRYPAASRRAREEGTVMLKVLVSPDGRAQELAVQTSSGFKRLDEAALATVRRWAFLPAKKAGQPVPAWVLVPVTFALG